MHRELTMIRFRDFVLSYMTEEKEDKKEKQINGSLHELLTGYYLNGGRHMEQHPNNKGESPQEAHDRIKKNMSPGIYAEHQARAKHAADAITQAVGGKKNIKKVHWTSKRGDINRVTGSNQSQNEDPSDLYITHHDGTHTGISLKAHSAKGKHGHFKAPGLGTIDKSLKIEGHNELIDQARKRLAKLHPKVENSKNEDEMSSMVSNDEKLKNDESRERNALLPQIAKNWHEKYAAMSKKKLSDHLRNLIHANKTTHNHIRVTTSGVGNNFESNVIHPHTHYDHILNDHQNLGVEHVGNSVNFTHKGRNIFTLRAKTKSGAGVMGTIKADVDGSRISK